MKKLKLSQKKQAELVEKFGHIPTQEEVFQKILESQERLAEALKGAWETKPSDPEVEKDLLEVGERAGKLRKELQKILKKKK